MRQTHPKPYENFIHPYVFVLKEGNEIHKDFLDYSLLMLQVGQAELLPSPNKTNLINNNFQLFKRSFPMT